jgi:4-amino-4-deoxy-L-arabinose transferase-like glycosyltransferase
MKHLNLVILTAIVVLAFFLRAYRVTETPPSLNWDEASIGYNAFSILKTGGDEWGTHPPFIFKAFGDYKLPLYIYLTVLPVALLGLNVIAVRIVSILAGTLAVLITYFLAKELFPRSKSIGIISSFLMAICPWHFFISRPGLEANLALTFILAGALFIVKSAKDNRYLLLSSVFFSLSLHTYNTARVFVPLFILVFFLINLAKFKLNRFLCVSGALFLISFGLVVYQFITGSGLARYDKLAILSPSAVYTLGQQRATSDYPPLISKLIYNRPVYFVKEFGKNYSSYFTPQFFYQSSGSQTQFAIPGENLFGLPVLLTGIIGVYFLIRKKSKSGLLILSWLLLSPVAAALTDSPPQALRPNPMIPAVILLAGYALSEFPKILKTILLIIFALSFALYLNTYFSSYRVNYSPSWQYGYQEVVEYIKNNQSKYNHVIFTKKYGEPHIFYAFFLPLNPEVLQNSQDSLRFFQSGWYWTDRINNIYFVNDWDIPNQTSVGFIKLESGEKVPTNNTLLITSPGHIPANAVILKTVAFLDGKPAFLITHIK